MAKKIFIGIFIVSVICNIIFVGIYISSQISNRETTEQRLENQHRANRIEHLISIRTAIINEQETRITELGGAIKNIESISNRLNEIEQESDKLKRRIETRIQGISDPVSENLKIYEELLQQ